MSMILDAVFIIAIAVLLNILWHNVRIYMKYVFLVSKNKATIQDIATTRMTQSEFIEFIDAHEVPHWVKYQTSDGEKSVREIKHPKSANLSIVMFSKIPLTVKDLRQYASELNIIRERFYDVDGEIECYVNKDSDLYFSRANDNKMLEVQPNTLFLVPYKEKTTLS